MTTDKTLTIRTETGHVIDLDLDAAVHVANIGFFSAGVDVNRAFASVEDREAALLKVWQFIVDSEALDNLPGVYRRTAMELMEQGYISPRGATRRPGSYH